MPPNSKKQILGFVWHIQRKHQTLTGLHVTWWPESNDFLELKQRTSEKTALPRYLGQAWVPFSHCCFFSFVERQWMPCLHFPNPYEGRESSSFDYGLSETASLWAHDKLIFHLLLLKGSEFTKVLHLNYKLTLGFLSKFTVSEFATLPTIPHLVPNSSFKITVPFWNVFEVLLFCKSPSATTSCLYLHCIF